MIKIKTAGNSMFALWPGDRLNFSIFIKPAFGFVGQRAASEAGHIANTNVSGKLPGQITMRLINGIILLLTVSLTSYGQVTEKDSLISSRYSNELVKKCFDGLTKSSTLDTLEKKLGFHFCSIAACVNPFSIRYLKGQDSESVKLRLQEIAERLVKDGTPVILFGGEQSDLKDTDKLNTDHNGNNITYLATGNCCYRFYNEAYFEDAFNQRTKELLGIVKPKKKRKAASR